MPCAATPVPTPDVASIFAAYRAATARLGVHPVRTLEVRGLITGPDVVGIYHAWIAGDDERIDEDYGVQSTTLYRIGDRAFLRDENGDVRELRHEGLREVRDRLWIERGGFLDDPSSARVLGIGTSDGRPIVVVRVIAPDGDEQTLGFDRASGLLDERSYRTPDGVVREIYRDRRLVGGALIAYRRIEERPLPPSPLERVVLSAVADAPITPGIFAVPSQPIVATQRPVRIPLQWRNAHLFAPIALRGRQYWFLVDTGAQSIVVDRRVAAQALLVPQTSVEITGLHRVSGGSIAALDAIVVGGVRVPIGVVSIVDLGAATSGAFPIAGILGRPFFSAADVRIEPARAAMVVAPPGTLRREGTCLPLDIDAGLPLVEASVQGVRGRFLLDTGNGDELLLDRRFVDAHPGLVDVLEGAPLPNAGIGGSVRAVRVTIGELDLGGYRLYHRATDVLLDSAGAFQANGVSGNIGLGTLKNFTTTFDLEDEIVCVRPGGLFDDGRFRTGVERTLIPPPRRR